RRPRPVPAARRARAARGRRPHRCPRAVPGGRRVMNPETLLDETLRSYAAHAPDAAGLLDAVRDRADRRRRTRMFATAGLATAMVAALVAGGLATRTPV